MVDTSIREPYSVANYGTDLETIRKIGHALTGDKYMKIDYLSHQRIASFGKPFGHLSGHLSERGLDYAQVGQLIAVINKDKRALEDRISFEIEDLRRRTYHPLNYFTRDNLGELYDAYMLAGFDRNDEMKRSYGTRANTILTKMTKSQLAEAERKFGHITVQELLRVGMETVGFQLDLVEI